ncbi:unnamed protein product [Periconia digitata]|uniref:FAD dependent oxidoreductase domain-containing protein n=1 Tax=Periconia digitata TaxID=1303443 RepID=A0A9W4XRP4_9PLEO|nr:unnamed protein product [Periconia digitata]
MKHGRSSLPTPTSTNSFWHTEPNEFLLGHQTTAELPEEADIVIVGSGISGANAARYLIEDGRADGLKIVMLEAREACWGATGRNGGHCQPLLFDRGPDVADFELQNVSAVKSYIEKHSVPCEWRSVTGCRSFWTAETMEAAEKEVARLHSAAPEIGKLVTIVKDKEEMEKHRVNPAAKGITLSQNAASLWPYKLVTFILEQLVKEGKLNLQTKTPVTEITSSDNSHTIHTPRGKITSPTVILATNGYTSALLPQFADLIVPVRAQMSALIPPANSTILPDSHGMVGAPGQPFWNDDYLIQRPYSDVPNPAGHLMFGGGRGDGAYPTVCVSDDSVLDEKIAAYLRRALLTVLKLDGSTQGLEELKAAKEWTGIMGYSRDDHPWVGKVPGKEGLWLCGGYTGHGMPNGTLCGRAIAKLVLGNREGKELDEMQAEMVGKAELPASYLITEERIEKARLFPIVERQNDPVIV